MTEAAAVVVVVVEGLSVVHGKALGSSMKKSIAVSVL